MPNWSPNWTDVRFDEAAAEQAAAACERAARLVREITARRAVMAAFALLGSQGPWQDQLHRRLRSIYGRSEEMESRLRAVAAALRDASARAHGEQASRVAERQRWQDESKVESVLASSPPASALPPTPAPGMRQAT